MEIGSGYLPPEAQHLAEASEKTQELTKLEPRVDREKLEKNNCTMIDLTSLCTSD